MAFLRYSLAKRTVRVLVQAVSNGEGMPPKKREYNRISLSLQQAVPQEADDQEEPPVTRSKSRQRSRSRSRPAAARQPAATPSRLLRFQEGPPKVLAKAANVRIHCSWPGHSSN